MLTTIIVIISVITVFLILIPIITTLIIFITLGFVLPPKPILVTERMVIIPREVRDGVSVFTIQKATWINMFKRMNEQTIEQKDSGSRMEIFLYNLEYHLLTQEQTTTRVRGK